MSHMLGRRIAATSFSFVAIFAILASPDVTNAVCFGTAAAEDCGRDPAPAASNGLLRSSLDGLPTAVAEPEEPPLLLAGGLIALSIVGSALYLGRVLGSRRPAVSVADAVMSDPEPTIAPISAARHAALEPAPASSGGSVSSAGAAAPPGVAGDGGRAGLWRGGGSVAAGVITSVVVSVAASLVVQGATYAPVIVGLIAGCAVAGFLLHARTVTAWIAASALVLLSQAAAGIALAIFVSAVE